MGSASRRCSFAKSGTPAGPLATISPSRMADLAGRSRSSEAMVAKRELKSWPFRLKITTSIVHLALIIFRELWELSFLRGMVANTDMPSTNRTRGTRRIRRGPL
jgi:hypothetical protein